MAHGFKYYLYADESQTAVQLLTVLFFPLLSLEILEAVLTSLFLTLPRYSSSTISIVSTIRIYLKFSSNHPQGHHPDLNLSSRLLLITS